MQDRTEEKVRISYTRERLIQVALELFSEYGYEGTSVEQIASAVGIKAPSIYAHFKGKEDILKAVLDWTDQEYEKGMKLGIYKEAEIRTGADLKAYAMKSVKFTLDSEMIKKMRKLITIEQYRNEVFTESATRHQLTNHIRVYALIFKKLMDDGVMIKGDPEIVALEFIAPVSLMIQLHDREPNRKKEILKTIKKHMDEFINRYF